MRTTVEEGLHVLRVPGVVLRSEEADLLWPSYMALVLDYPELVKNKSADVVDVLCVA